MLITGGGDGPLLRGGLRVDRSGLHGVLPVNEGRDVVEGLGVEEAHVLLDGGDDASVRGVQPSADGELAAGANGHGACVGLGGWIVADVFIDGRRGCGGERVAQDASGVVRAVVGVDEQVGRSEEIGVGIEDADGDSVRVAVEVSPAKGVRSTR